MDAFAKHRGIVAILDKSNIDTDQIIAKQFLKSIARTGFGPQLFYDWAHNPDGSVNQDFPLNQTKFKNASILIAGNNFGCGSSREHAVWAVAQYGFKVIISPINRVGSGEKVELIPGFADIFKNNCGKNGIVTIELPITDHGLMIHEINSQNSPVEMTVDLVKQEIKLHTASWKGRNPIKFEYDQAVKERLLNGLDDIGITLKEEQSITNFEKNHSAQIYG